MHLIYLLALILVPVFAAPTVRKPLKHGNLVSAGVGEHGKNFHPFPGVVLDNPHLQTGHREGDAIVPHQGWRSPFFPPSPPPASNRKQKEGQPPHVYTRAYVSTISPRSLILPKLEPLRRVNRVRSRSPAQLPPNRNKPLPSINKPLPPIPASAARWQRLKELIVGSPSSPSWRQKGKFNEYRNNYSVSQRLGEVLHVTSLGQVHSANHPPAQPPAQVRRLPRPPVHH
ncbi:hypothetical protein M413DRAFT_347867 [Hebeloma cylindrosporum]|uniref:Uncharacterized protein n=1 Tax=Hebeloma cylindrosporum TaxID=76867 RepID=A0A0C3BW00_HEBCY|nr:hypothetical protein M413DRAFT_347867 [Hebeloma cylindrosporum h7]